MRKHVERELSSHYNVFVSLEQELNNELQWFNIEVFQVA